MAGMKVTVAAAMALLLVSSVVATIDDCPTANGAAKEMCRSCFFSKEVSDTLKESTCLKCSASSDPWACLSCLTGPAAEDVKATGCLSCASTDKPYSCNSCLAASTTTKVAIDVCPVCASFDDASVGICTSCVLTPFDVEDNKTYCPDCADFFELQPDGTRDGDRTNTCNVCLTSAKTTEEAEACLA